MIKCTLIPLLGIIFTTNLFAETIRISSGEWAPFVSKYSYHYGIDSHIVTEAFKLEGIDVQWGFFPWGRAFKYAKVGEQWDASCCWRSRKEVEEFFLFSEAITKTSYVFFHLQSYNFDWTSMNNLSGIKIGLTTKYHYGEQFMHAIATEKLDVQTTPQDEYNFKKLLSGRIDIFPNDLAVGKSQIKNLLSPQNASQLTHDPKEFGQNALHLILSKNDNRAQYLLHKFARGMKKLRASGRYKSMLKDLKAGKYDQKKEIWKQP